jgi:inhibitor of cysteine peptidase
VPCADCSGIQVRLTLFAKHGSGDPVLYHLQQTDVGTRDGDRTTIASGRWALQRGTPTDPAAAVYVLDFDKPNEQRSLRVTGGDSLLFLDRTQNEIVSRHTYALAPDAGADAPAWVDAGTASAVTLRPGQEVFVGLVANRSTGFQWALADTARSVVAPQGTHYVQDTATGLAVGVGGHEFWRLRAVRPGSQTLVFEYRRPWETQTPAARTATLAVTVR